MFFYAPPTRFKYNVEITALRDMDDARLKAQYITQIAKWSEQRWGYINKFPGIAFQEQDIRRFEHTYFILRYGGTLIGMFALATYNSTDTLLSSVYIDEPMRGLGLGTLIVNHAKQLSSQAGARSMVLNTLSPLINRFYLKNGATMVCESRVEKEPVSLLRIDCKEKPARIPEPTGFLSKLVSGCRIS